MAGLWDALKQYIGDALPGGALNPETEPVAKQANYLSGILDPASQVSQDATNWHKRTQNGLMDQLAGRDTPEAEQAYQTMMMAAGMAPIGMTAWHGSPHKFDKFSLDKIGTGEGAQAYGHGLYLAESPDVAKGYQEKLSKSVSVQGRKLDSIPADGPLANAHNSVITNIQGGMKPEDAIRAAAKYWDDASNEMLGFMQSNPELASHIKKEASSRADIAKHAKAMNPADFYLDPGNLYKTDIPDEAVARFLDWDKPLSQQAPEVQAALKPILGNKYKDSLYGQDVWEGLVRSNYNKVPVVQKADGAYLETGKRFGMSSDQLQQAGIPGIRYLDGGSRGAGQGSSNFVAFDPEMIRILERNGQATGLQPWKPGEWKR